MRLTIIDRFHPHWRRKQQALLDAGHGRKIDEVALLEAQQLPALARLSLALQLGGLALFVVLTFVTLYWQDGRLALTVSFWGVILWIVLNIVGYFAILPVHEAIHGLAFAFWGGRPSFGAKLPLALYCGAREQLFRRNHYLVVGLAPLVIITLAGILFTLLRPSLASYTLLATSGNISGACGDLMVAARLLRQSPDVLIEDTDAGYTAWEIIP